MKHSNRYIFLLQELAVVYLTQSALMSQKQMTVKLHPHQKIYTSKTYGKYLNKRKCDKMLVSKF